MYQIISFYSRMVASRKHATVRDFLGRNLNKMSLLSKALGLDRPSNKPLLTAINAAGNAALGDIESHNPEIATAVKVVEVTGNIDPELGGNEFREMPRFSPHTITAAQVGHVILAVDPALPDQIIKAVNAILDKHNLHYTETEVDALITQGLKQSA